MELDLNVFLLKNYMYIVSVSLQWKFRLSIYIKIRNSNGQMLVACVYITTATKNMQINNTKHKQEA